MQFNALCDRWLEAEKRQERRKAELMTLLANINRNPKKKARPYRLSDFMVGAPEEQEKELLWVEEPNG